MKKSKNLFSRIWTWFKGTSYCESFRQLDRRILYSALFDLAFVLSIVLVSVIVSIAMDIIDFSALQDFAQTQSLQNLPAIQMIMWKIILTLFLLYVLLLGAWSYSRNLIFNKLYGNRFSWTVFGKSYLINFVSMSVFLAFFILVSNIVTEAALPFVALIMMILYAYKMNIFFTLFFKKGKFKEAFSKMFTVGLAKVHILYTMALIGFITIILGMALINTVLTMLNFTRNPSTETAITYLLGIYLLFGFAWLRNLVVIVVDRLDR